MRRKNAAHRLGKTAANAVDIPVGARFGIRTVIAGPTVRNGRRYYRVRCQCGGEQDVKSDALRIQTNANHSCGCARYVRISDDSGVRLRRIWNHMRSRCGNPRDVSYPRYGARGIRVCEEWQDFTAFALWAREHGYSGLLFIDRIDNDRGYSPDNCRWLTPDASNTNRRDLHLLTAFGESKSVRRWVQDSRCAVGRATLLARLGNGWTVEDALLTQPDNWHQRRYNPTGERPKRRFVDAPAAIRCVGVVKLRDRSIAQCGRRRTHGRYCWQHDPDKGTGEHIASQRPPDAGGVTGGLND